MRWRTMIVVVALTSCHTPQRTYFPPPPPDATVREVHFQDTDAFDALLESHLSNGVPAVRVLTDSTDADWPPRLVAWLRAYQAGGRVRPVSGGAIDALVYLAAGSSTPTEARILVEGLLDRAERGAVVAADWWEREAERKRRVELLKPYMLDAVTDPSRGGKYTLLMYNGHYPESYKSQRTHQP